MSPSFSPDIYIEKATNFSGHNGARGDRALLQEAPGQADDVLNKTILIYENYGQYLIPDMVEVEERLFRTAVQLSESIEEGSADKSLVFDMETIIDDFQSVANRAERMIDRVNEADEELADLANKSNQELAYRLGTSQVTLSLIKIECELFIENSKLVAECLDDIDT